MYLSMYRKSEMEYEEDKDDIDLEIKRVKKIIFYLNSNEAGVLNVNSF